MNALLLVWEFEGVNSEAICILLQRTINGFVSFVKLLQIIDKSMSVSIVFWMVGAWCLILSAVSCFRFISSTYGIV